MKPVKLAIKNAASHNKRLNSFLDSLKTSCRNSKSKEDVEKIAKEIEGHTKTSELKYNNTKSIYFAVFCGIVAVIAWVSYSPHESGYENAQFVIWGAIITGVVVLLVSFLSKRSRIKEVSNQLLLKSHLIHNNLENPDFSGKDLWSSWGERFVGFDRGHESRYIDRYYKGSYDYEEVNINYELFRFHYVVVTKSTVTKYNALTKRNETRTETTRRTYYRYGMIMEFPYASGICMSGEGYKPYPEKWTTTSDQFNKLFKVTTDDKMTSAKILQPTVILELINKIGELKNITLEINRGSSLCLTCTDSGLVPFYKEIMLSDTTNYLRAIRNPQINTRLTQMLNGIAMIIRFNDKNLNSQTT